ncbi:Squalene-hopene/tetraprenyl-beta-curcumene cyclase [Planctomycetales bacterium 10988]|nr:Squalene-hopene/tetraprenyl-beta-curcumene cyclase [Planctomycetales bacterium 10988]
MKASNLPMGRQPLALIMTLLVLTAATSLPAQETGTASVQKEQMITKAIQYLEKAQLEDGSYQTAMKLPVTAIVTTGVLRSGRSASDPLVAKSLSYIQGFVQEDGGIYAPDSTHRNYETCIALLCMSEANRDGRFDKLIQNAKTFITGMQWDEEDGTEVTDPAYGGAGYGRHRRPDLSNTQFFIDALHAAGVGPEEEAMKKALVFISRCQNLESEHNTSPFSAKVNDGGFYYTVAAGGSSQAGETEDGGLRSYASMTYAGLKSMIFAGVDESDPRVEAAYKWACKHYTLEENPGMGTSGLFYYYHTFSKALDAMEVETMVEENGTKHDWQAELAKELAERQNPDGSWTNDNPRWMEGDPILTTGYSLLTLSYCE